MTMSAIGHKPRARCPENRAHREFTVTVHVTQDWRVSETGEFIAEVKSCVEVTHRPDPEDVWTCAECGRQAVFRQPCPACHVGDTGHVEALVADVRYRTDDKCTLVWVNKKAGTNGDADSYIVQFGDGQQAEIWPEEFVPAPELREGE
jgi:hypothetical protein